MWVRMIWLGYGWGVWDGVGMWSGGWVCKVHFFPTHSNPSHILLDSPHHTPPTLNSTTHIPTPQYHIHPVTQLNTPLPLPIHGCFHFYHTSTYPYPILTHHDFPFPTLPYPPTATPAPTPTYLSSRSHPTSAPTRRYLSSHRYSANLR